jgi:hypothetical protein
LWKFQIFFIGFLLRLLSLICTLFSCLSLFLVIYDC